MTARSASEERRREDVAFNQKRQNVFRVCNICSFVDRRIQMQIYRRANILPLAFLKPSSLCCPESCASLIISASSVPAPSFPISGAQSRYARLTIQSFKMQLLSYGPSTLSHWVCCSSILPSWWGHTLYLSPALNDRSLGDRLIAIRYYDTHEITSTLAICMLSVGIQNGSWTQRLLKMEWSWYLILTHM